MDRAGVRYGFPSPETLFYAGKTFADVQTVPSGSLIFIPRVPPDGTYVQEFRTGNLYLVLRGRRLALTEDELYFRGDSPHDVVVVPWGTLGGIPYGGRYRGWKAGRLAPIAVPLSWLYHTRVARLGGAWFGTAIVGGVVSGAIVAWLFGP